MVIGQGGNASGDVSVFREGDTYYMFCTGGGAWTSDNMLDWSFTPVRNVPVAPDVVKYRGKFYMSGNDCPLYVADNPLGPYDGFIIDFRNVCQRKNSHQRSVSVVVC